MATIPDRIVSVPRKIAQAILVVPGIFILLGALGTFADNPAGAIGMGLVGGLMLIGGLSIKTTYRLQGGEAVYD